MSIVLLYSIALFVLILGVIFFVLYFRQKFPTHNGQSREIEYGRGHPTEDSPKPRPI